MWIRQWTFGFHKLLASSWVAAQLTASQEGLSTMKFATEFISLWAVQRCRHISDHLRSNWGIRKWLRNDVQLGGRGPIKCTLSELSWVLMRESLFSRHNFRPDVCFTFSFRSETASLIINRTSRRYIERYFHGTASSWIPKFHLIAHTYHPLLHHEAACLNVHYTFLPDHLLCISFLLVLRSSIPQKNTCNTIQPHCVSKWLRASVPPPVRTLLWKLFWWTRLLHVLRRRIRVWVVKWRLNLASITNPFANLNTGLYADCRTLCGMFQTIIALFNALNTIKYFFQVLYTFRWSPANELGIHECPTSRSDWEANTTHLLLYTYNIRH
jgi:hypothetical protein